LCYDPLRFILCFSDLCSLVIAIYVDSMIFIGPHPCISLCHSLFHRMSFASDAEIRPLHLCVFSRFFCFFLCFCLPGRCPGWPSFHCGPSRAGRICVSQSPGTSGNGLAPDLASAPVQKTTPGANHPRKPGTSGNGVKMS